MREKLRNEYSEDMVFYGTHVFSWEVGKRIFLGWWLEDPCGAEF